MSDLIERTLIRSGSTIHYWVGGVEGRPLVTLTHGATMDHRMFDSQVAALLDTYRVLVWDVRGHGRSQPLGTNFSIRAASEDLLALVDHEGCQQAVFVGQSMGGYIAQEVVFRQPERALALVTIGVTSITRTYPKWDSLLLALTPAIVMLWPYDLFEALHGAGYGAVARSARLRLRCYESGAQNRCSDHHERRGARFAPGTRLSHSRSGAAHSR